MKRTFLTITLAATLMVAATGCAKNVDRIQFQKWGNSFVPSRGNSGMDTTAQGGAAQNNVIPQSTDYLAPKAAVGGAYHRTFAHSTHYNMVGGFHTPTGN